VNVRRSSDAPAPVLGCGIDDGINKPAEYLISTSDQQAGGRVGVSLSIHTQDYQPSVVV
jgi:hypothetical protein